jgi:hypothetical protein
MKKPTSRLNKARENLATSIVAQIMRDKAKILDDFSRAYLAAALTADRDFSYRRLVLNEQVFPDGMNRKCWFTLKRGPLPKQSAITPARKNPTSKKKT